MTFMHVCMKITYARRLAAFGICSCYQLFKELENGMVEGTNKGCR